MPSDLRLLVIRLSALGDIVLTTSLLAALRALHPGLHVTFVTKARYAPVLAGTPGLTAIGLEIGEPVAALAQRMPPQRLDGCIDLQGAWRSVILRRLLPPSLPWYAVRKPRLARARLIWGAGSGPGAATTVSRYLETARAFGVSAPAPPPALFTPADPEAAAALRGVSHPVALAPGAAHWSKRWPAEHWRALAADLRGRGLTPVAVGRPEDVAVLPPESAMDTSRLSLTGSIDVVRRSAVLVTNDSGLLHVATATGTPRVALFGPTTPAQGFAPADAGARILERPLPCRPCSTFGGADCPAGHHRCLRDIRPSQVADLVESLAS